MIHRHESSASQNEGLLNGCEASTEELSSWQRRATPSGGCWPTCLAAVCLLVAALLSEALVWGHSLRSAAWLFNSATPGNGGPCPSILRAKPLGDQCVVYYNSTVGPLACLYNDTSSSPGPCRFNTSTLACTLPTAMALDLVPSPGCLHNAGSTSRRPWHAAAAAAREAAASWRLGRQQRQGPVAALADQQQPHSTPTAQPSQQQLQQSGAPQLPTRRVQHPTLRGSWAAPPPLEGPGWQPGLAFQPAESERCPGAAVGSAQALLAWARASGIRRIAMAGDSTMRQLYQRVAGLARGQSDILDMTGQRFAHYELCRAAEGVGAGSSNTSSSSSSSRRSSSGAIGSSSGALRDSLWFSLDVGTDPKEQEKLRARSGDIKALLAKQLQLLVQRTAPNAQGACGAASSREGGSSGEGGEGGGVWRRELVVDLLMGSLWDLQAAHARAYLRAVLGGSSGGSSGSSGGSSGGSSTAARGQETVLVLSVCYWAMGAGDGRVWGGYIVFLREAAKLVRHVVVVTCPIPPGLQSAAQKALAARNAALRKLVAADAAARAGSSGAGLRLLDAAVMLEGVPANATLAAHQYHYGCVFARSGQAPASVVYPREGRGQMTYNAIKVEGDGACQDPVNFSLWQALLCLLTGGGGSEVPPPQ